MSQQRSSLASAVGWGVVLGAAAVGLSLTTGGTQSAGAALALAIALGAPFLAATLAARRSRRVHSGTLAGLIVGIALLLVYHFVGLPPILRDLRIPGLSMALNAESLIALALAAGIGLLGGLLGRPPSPSTAAGSGPATHVPSRAAPLPHPARAKVHGRLALGPDDSAESADAEQLLVEVLSVLEDDLAIKHPWMWEGNRWKELVFALLTRVAPLPEQDTRATVEQMNRSGLLDISLLASIAGASGSHPEQSSPQARQIRESLRATGFSMAEAERALTAMCEAAHGLQEHFGGKVQRYLRDYGELMLLDLGRVFQFSTLSEADAADAFTYWFQNVLSLPLSLIDTDLKAFADQRGLDPHLMIQAADNMDLNLALLDDLVQRYMAVRKQADEQPRAAAQSVAALD